MKTEIDKRSAGFSMIELLVAMIVVIILLAIVSTVLSRAMAVRARESRKTDAQTSAQAALNLMSREISNAGFGIYDDAVTQRANNGLVLGDCSENRIHLRANIENLGSRQLPPGSTVLSTNRAGEDITYYFDASSNSIVRYDPHGLANGSPQTSVVVNKISTATFSYVDYVSGSSTPSAGSTTPTADTGRILITVEVALDPVYGQPNPQRVVFTTEVTLRNANYMLYQY